MCAGLFKNAFEVATTSSDPFMCHHCRLVEQVADLASLKCSVRDLADKLSSLKATIVNLQANANASSVSASCNHAPLPVSASTESAEDLNSQLVVSVSASVLVISNSVMKRDPHHTSDKITKSYFLVLRNVLWVLLDISTWSQILIMSSKLFLADNSIQKHSNKDCFRLGNFNPTSDCARTVLVKFVRTADVSRIMSKKISLKLPFFVNPDLSPEKMLREATLLKERWNLIQSGTERKLIKIRNDSILVSCKVYGRLVGSASNSPLLLIRLRSPLYLPIGRFI